MNAIHTSRLRDPMDVRADGADAGSLETITMTEKTLAAAKKAARRLARATGTPYQTCLDMVAQQTGRSHWGAYLADPVPLEAHATPADKMPDIDDVGPAAQDTRHDEAPYAWPIGRDQTSETMTQVHVREHVITMMEPERDEKPSWSSRVARMLIGPERGIVKRSRERRVLAGRKGRTMGPVGMPLGRSVENGYELMLDETLPVLALSPPGTGKTASVVIPTIITCDGNSLVVHDETGLAEMTSGYRATLGPVTVLDLAGGRSKGSLNPLSREWLPIDPSARASYIGALAQCISPGDRRAAHVIERSIQAMCGDGSGTTFAILDAHVRKTYANQERTATMALAPFLDPSVTSCTTDSGYRPNDLRGSRNEDGLMGPTTLYIVRGPAGNDRQGLVAAALQGAIWWWTLMVGPGMRSPDGDVHGVSPVTIILEDMHRLPVMPGFINAVERGRARKLAHIVTAPSYRALSRAVGCRVDEMEALFAIQIILSQNDPESMARLERRLYGVTRRDLVTQHGTHLIAFQYESEPVRVKTPFFYKDPERLAKVYNPRTGRGPKPITM